MGRLQWGTQDRSSTRTLLHFFERFYRNQIPPPFCVMYGGLVVGSFGVGRVCPAILVVEDDQSDSDHDLR